VRMRLPLGSSVTPGARRTRIRTPTITIRIIPVSIRVASISNYREAPPPRQTLPPTIHPLSSIICSCKAPSHRLWTSSSIFILLGDRVGSGEPFLMTDQVPNLRATHQFRQKSIHFVKERGNFVHKARQFIVRHRLDTATRKLITFLRKIFSVLLFFSWAFQIVPLLRGEFSEHEII